MLSRLFCFMVTLCFSSNCISGLCCSHLYQTGHLMIVFFVLIQEWWFILQHLKKYEWFPNCLIQWQHSTGTNLNSQHLFGYTVENLLTNLHFTLSWFISTGHSWHNVWCLYVRCFQLVSCLISTIFLHFCIYQLKCLFTMSLLGLFCELFMPVF